MKYENENVEYKVQMGSNVYKEVIAFANSDGGTIYIGIDDQGNHVGIEDIDEAYTRLTNGIRDTIAPDVTMFVRYTLEENEIIRIEVSEGSYKPYYLRTKGLKPSGVYVRQGSSSVQASPEQIRRMIKESDGDIFEEMRTSNQNLTFEETTNEFQKYNVEFTEQKHIALGLKNIHDGRYTNLALLLSDQCSHTIKIAVFEDFANTKFRDKKEFRGSIFKQLDNSYFYLSLCNRTAAKIVGLRRVEKKDYPEDALREGLINALIHRDYSFSGSIIINVNDERIEFISLGGLLPGLSTEDICSGISQPRNCKLAEIFHRLDLIESYGTGIRRIFDLYKDHPIQPRIEVTPNTFKLILPNMNAPVKEVDSSSASNNSSAQPDIMVITPQMKIVIEYLQRHGEMTDETMQSLLNIKKTRSYLLARQMKERNLIDIVGRGAAKRYRLK